MDKKISKLIDKYFQQTITDKEFRTLKEWVLSSDNNKESFKESLVHYKKTIVTQYVVDDILKKSKRSRFALMIGSAAAVFIGLIFTAIFMFDRKKEEQTVVAEKVVVLEATKKGVILTTSGETIELEKAAGTILPSGVAVTDTNIDYSKKESVVTSLIAEQSSISVPKGERFQITLSDGTKLWINADTKVEYPSFFSDSCRRIKVEGEVYLDVAHDKKRPFIVEVYDAEIKVLGTKFNISAYPEEENIKTTLLEGSVSFKTDEMSTILTPNEQLTINKLSSQYKIENVEAERSCQWMEDVYHFDEIPLIDLTKLFNRIYGVEVTIHNVLSMNKRFTGTILKSIPYPEMFEIIIKTTDVKYEIEKEKIVIR